MYFLCSWQVDLRVGCVCVCARVRYIYISHFDHHTADDELILMIFVIKWKAFQSFFFVPPWSFPVRRAFHEWNTAQPDLVYLMAGFFCVFFYYFFFFFLRLQHTFPRRADQMTFGSERAKDVLFKYQSMWMYNWTVQLWWRLLPVCSGQGKIWHEHHILWMIDDRRVCLSEVRESKWFAYFFWIFSFWFGVVLRSMPSNFRRLIEKGTCKESNHQIFCIWQIKLFLNLKCRLRHSSRI